MSTAQGGGGKNTWRVCQQARATKRTAPGIRHRRRPLGGRGANHPGPERGGGRIDFGGNGFYTSYTSQSPWRKRWGRKRSRSEPPLWCRLKKEFGRRCSSFLAMRHAYRQRRSHGARDHARETYSPVRVLTLIISPCCTNSGMRTTAPVSRAAGLPTKLPSNR